MQESERYTEICEPKFAELLREIKATNQQLVTLNHKLFIDNGTKSVMSRIKDMETWTAVVKWFTITTSGGFILAMIGLIFYLIQQRLGG